jgi:hypothetical protein
LKIKNALLKPVYCHGMHHLQSCDTISFILHAVLSDLWTLYSELSLQDCDKCALLNCWHILEIWKLHLHLSACNTIQTMLLGPLKDTAIETNSF